MPAKALMNMINVVYPEIGVSNIHIIKEYINNTTLIKMKIIPKTIPNCKGSFDSEDIAENDNANNLKKNICCFRQFVFAPHIPMLSY